MRNLAEIDAIHIAYDPITITEPEQVMIAQIFSHPTVVKYLKFLESDLLRDFNNIPLQSVIDNPQEVALKQAFVKGSVNITQTLLQIHKSATQTQTAR